MFWPHEKLRAEAGVGGGVCRREHYGALYVSQWQTACWQEMAVPMWKQSYGFSDTRIQISIHSRTARQNSFFPLSNKCVFAWQILIGIYSRGQRKALSNNERGSQKKRLGKKLVSSRAILKRAKFVSMASKRRNLATLKHTHQHIRTLDNVESSLFSLWRGFYNLTRQRQTCSN